MQDSKGNANGGRPVPDPVYVNHCAVTADLSDARLDFGQATSDGAGLRINARLVTSPTHLKRFRDAIDDACRDHEARFQPKGTGDED